MKPREELPSERLKDLEITDSNSAEKEDDSPEPDPALNSAHYTNSSTLSVIDDEFLRVRIRKLIEEQLPTRQYFPTNILASIILGSILAVLVGGFFVLYFGFKQIEMQRVAESPKLDQLHEEQRRGTDQLREGQRHETDMIIEGQKHIERLLAIPNKGGVRLYDKRQPVLDYNRNPSRQEVDYEKLFYAETNEIRLRKIDEVLGVIDETEAEIDRIIEGINKSANTTRPGEQGSETELGLSAFGLVTRQETTIKSNKYWLGEEIYNQLVVYHAINGRYVADKLVGPRGMDLSEALKKRAHAKQNILQLRRAFLDKEYMLNNSLKKARP